MTYFIYHQSGKLKVIAESDVPLRSAFDDHGSHSLVKEAHEKALSTAPLTKGITVENAFIRSDHKGQSPDIYLSDGRTIGDPGKYLENMLYLVPKEFQVRIRDNPVVPKNENGGIVMRSFEKVATLVPVEKSEPVDNCPCLGPGCKCMRNKAISESSVKEEDQDELWSDIERLIMSFSWEEIKSKYHISRK